MTCYNTEFCCCCQYRDTWLCEVCPGGSKSGTSLKASDIKILIDMDEVLTGLTEPWMIELNKMYSRNVKMDDITDWNMSIAFPGLTNKEIYAPFHIDGFWDKIKPIVGAVEYTTMLANEGFKLYVCTATHPDNIKVKTGILEKHFPFFSWRNLIMTKEKQMVCADFLIDDNKDNLIGGSYEKILFTASYNKTYDAEANGMHRANGWEHVYELIHQITNV